MLRPVLGRPRRSRGPLALAVLSVLVVLAVIAGVTLWPRSAPVATGPAASAEPYRPAYHFTTAKNWLNDPNGLVFHKGVYHLFFQHNPYGDRWGNMSWGHATSTDLVHWSEQPIALRQGLNAAGASTEDIFSGSVVVDTANSTGFGTSDNPPLVAIYTSAYQPADPQRAGIQAQSLAYSLDDGRTWTKYAGNPVLDRRSQNFRDPKVFAYDGPAGRYWVMTAVEAVERKVVLYKSTDLKSWTHLSDFGPANATGGIWECPDLFPLKVRGTDETKWVLITSLNPGAVAGGSGAQYFVGDFDGVTFRSESTMDRGSQPEDQFLDGIDWLDWGRDHYAAVTFSGLPPGRAVTVGWMSNWEYANEVPTSPWRGAMTLPRELSLVPTDRGPRLEQLPVESVDQLAGPPLLRLQDEPLTGTRVLPTSGDVVRIDATLQPGTARRVGLTVLGNERSRTVIGYDTDSGRLSLDRTRSGRVDFHEAFPSVEHAPVALRDGRLQLRVYVDRSSVEVFADGGRATLTDQVFPEAGADDIGLWSEGGDAVVEELTVTPMDSAM